MKRDSFVKTNKPKKKDTQEYVCFTFYLFPFFYFHLILQTKVVQDSFHLLCDACEEFFVSCLHVVFASLAGSESACHCSWLWIHISTCMFHILFILFRNTSFECVLCIIRKHFPCEAIIPPQKISILFLQYVKVVIYTGNYFWNSISRRVHFAALICKKDMTDKRKVTYTYISTETHKVCFFA